MLSIITYYCDNFKYFRYAIYGENPKCSLSLRKVYGNAYREQVTLPYSKNRVCAADNEIWRGKTVSLPPPLFLS